MDARAGLDASEKRQNPDPAENRKRFPFRKQGTLSNKLYRIIESIILIRHLNIRQCESDRILQSNVK